MNVCSTQAVGVYGGVHVSNVVARCTPKVARISCQYLTCTLTHIHTMPYIHACTCVHGSCTCTIVMLG